MSEETFCETHGWNMVRGMCRACGVGVFVEVEQLNAANNERAAKLTAANAEIERLKAQFAAETLKTSKLTNVVAATRERLTLAGDHMVVSPASRHICSLCYLATMAHEALADTIYANDTVHHGLIESWERDRAAAILTEGGGK